jgi:hypothetical protein
MKRLIKIVTLAALAALATAAVASASVAVDASGNGFVGKGDVQTALGYKNDAAFQADAAKITFQYGDVAEISMAVVCTSDDVTYVTQHNVLGTVTAAKTVNFTTKGDKGKVTGYNLLGASGEATYTASLDTSRANMMACPTGTHFSQYLNGGTWDWDWNALPDSLTVTGSGASAGKTVALPNTPVL